jgi:hypothetical protein
MAGITLKIEGLNQLQKMLEFTDPKNFAKAQRAGLAKASKAVKTQVAKGIGERYNFKAARIKQDISDVSIASDGLSASIRFSRRSATLAQFGMKPGRRGGPQPGMGMGMGWGRPKPAGRPLSAMVIRADGRTTYKGAFVFIGKNGNQVVGRKDKQGTIKAIYGASVGSIFLGKGRYALELQEKAKLLINDEFAKGFQKKLDDIARGYGGR